MEKIEKLPVLVGLGLCFGVLMWLAPYIGMVSVLLPAKVAVLDPQNKASIIALNASISMVIATLSNIIIGAMSDLTRSRFGRRTPWIILGAIGSFISIFCIHSSTSVSTLILSWAIYQVFLNAIVAPLIAVISDAVTDKYRGRISSFYAVGMGAGGYIGQMIGAKFLINYEVGIIVMACITLASGFVSTLLIREKSNVHIERKEFSKDMLISNFSIPLKNCRDYYLALFGKMMIIIAKYIPQGFMLYLFTDFLLVSDKSVISSYILKMSMITLILSMALAAISGYVADKIKRFKIPVVISCIIVAIGLFIPQYFATPDSLIVYSVFLGLGVGVFNSVDQALNVEVLPNKETAAKDMGILNLSNTGGQILGPVAAAAIINAFGYHYLFMLAAVSALLGGAIILFIRSVK
ncbi:MFS transporter [Pectobacterium araliae]|uniref:MFS transporter n=1 Tax=Pectobacterium araliae TaxID=3073862 RepID=A0AAN0MJH4_9GAMM|nr:MFS transporter [Pectobacterium sp. MAFF 302110]GKW18793.1 MFS transporter [Pectobacterium carotovorum subsp. carotovorum]